MNNLLSIIFDENKQHLIFNFNNKTKLALEKIKNIPIKILNIKEVYSKYRLSKEERLFLDLYLLLSNPKGDKEEALRIVEIIKNNDEYKNFKQEWFNEIKKYLKI